MSLQRKVLLAQDAEGNPNHNPKNGQFASGSGGSKSASGSSGVKGISAEEADRMTDNPTSAVTSAINERKQNIGNPALGQGITPAQSGHPLISSAAEREDSKNYKQPKMSDLPDWKKSGSEGSGHSEAPGQKMNRPARSTDFSKQSYPTTEKELEGIRKSEESIRKNMKPSGYEWPEKQPAKSPQLEAYEKLQKEANETKMHPADFANKTESIKNDTEEQKYKTSLSSEHGRKAHRSIADAFNSGKSMKLGNYRTDGKAIYLHGNKIVEKNEAGEISFTQAGWPTRTTQAALRSFGIGVHTKGGKQLYSHSGGEEEINESETYKAKDEQPDSPDMALDPSSEAVNSAVPWKGRTLDNDPVGDRSAPTDMGAGSAGATWNGRTLD